MGVLRKITTWVGTHRLLSFGIFALLIGVTIFIWVQIEHKTGTLSAPLKKGTIIQSIYGIGTVTATKIFQITPGVISTLSAQFVEEGETVVKGTRLLMIDRDAFIAPFAGTITSLPFRVGDNVFSNVPILTLVDLSDRYVVVSLEQQGALRVVVGQKAVLSFDTMRESNFAGQVKSIYSFGTNFLARIDIPNLPPKILPGMTCDVSITLVTHENVLLLPIAALEEGKYVWLKSFIPKKIEIKVGLTDKAFAEVLDGNIKEGDQVLIRKQAGP